MDFQYHCPHIAPSTGVLQYCGDSNLWFLREDAADEAGAIIGYLECAAQIRHPKLSELFTRIAGEEAGHFIRLLQMISSLDPVQAEQLKQQELTILTLFNEDLVPVGGSCKDCSQFKDNQGHGYRTFQGEQKHYQSDFRVLECLGNAIRDELRAINAYQRQVQITANQNVQNLLITIMNKEKEHLAEFVKWLYELRHSHPSRKAEH